MTMEHLPTLPALVVLLALSMVGMTNLHANLRLYTAQSLLLGYIAIDAGRVHGEPLLVLVGVAVCLIKGIVVPAYLAYATRKIGCRRDSGLIIAPPLQLLLAIGCLAILTLARPFHYDIPADAVPALAVVLLGMLQMSTRRLAVSLIVGFLVLENGIFLYTVSQPHSMPVVVEIGVLMDVLAGAMLGGILAFQINRTFEHIDVTEMKELRG